jgi:hypothetical protein
MQISLVFQKSASIVNFLREKKLSTRLTLIWEPFPKGAIWCTPSTQLAQLLIELRGHFTIPGQDPAQRFLCLAYKKRLTRFSSKASRDFH